MRPQRLVAGLGAGRRLQRRNIFSVVLPKEERTRTHALASTA
jgi:hypothetical protein